MSLSGSAVVFADPNSQANPTATKFKEEISTTTAKAEDKKDDSKTEISTSTNVIVKAKKNQKKVALEDRKTCDIFTDLDSNINVLASTSQTAQVKIKDIKNTLTDEIDKKDSIVNNLKSLFSFKKSEVDVMLEAKSDVEEAEDFYKNLDEKVADERDYVDLNVCEKILRKELVNRYLTVETLTKSEADYRKSLTKKLKQSMSLLVQDYTEKEKTK